MAAFLTGCQKNATTQTPPTLLEQLSFSSTSDEFLQNFIVVDQGVLSLSITQHDAQYAGATSQGYEDLSALLSQINKSSDKSQIQAYKEELELTRKGLLSKAAYSGSYDPYNVPECDHFLINFLYVEDNDVVLKITEEDAVKCGATIDGYRALNESIDIEMDDIVEKSSLTYQYLAQAYDKRRADVLDPESPYNKFKNHLANGGDITNYTGQ